MAPARLNTQAIYEKRIKAIYSGHKRRAKDYGKTLDYDEHDLKKLSQFLGICPYCGMAMSVANFTFDHKEAVSQGGDFSLKNLVVCCDPCNRAKGIYSEDVWLLLLEVFKKFGTPTMRIDFLKRLKAGGAAVYGKRRRRWKKKH